MSTRSIHQWLITAPQETFEALLSVTQERGRQEAKGYTPEHDDEHGIQHIVTEAEQRLSGWGEAPTDEFVRHELVAAAALIVAAIESFDRGVARGQS